MKRLAAFLLTLTLIFCSSVTAFATGEMEEETTEHPETTEYPDDPSRAPDLVSGAAIVMDASTGQILYEKNAYDKKYPASITKIMTAMLTFEHGADFNEIITMSENAIWDVDRDSSLVGLDVGEKVTLGDVLYATMLYSDNSCAYTLAEYVAGDVPSFAELMNKKVEELGCQNTHFVTPNGLHDDNHYTCAYDMALITKAALQYDGFREVTGTVSYTIPATNLTTETRPLWNGNKMINPNEPYYYEYCEGGKTGYTTVAHNTLVTYSKKDGLELICVVLDCDGKKYAYSDSKALYKYCYNNYMYHYPLSDFSFDSNYQDDAKTNTILSNYFSSLDHEMIQLMINKDYSLLINKNVDTTQIQKEIVLYDEAKDNALGEIIFKYNDEVLGTTPITSSTPLLSSKISSSDQEKEKVPILKTIGKILIRIVIVIGALGILLIVFVIISSVIRNSKRNNRRKRYRRRRSKRDRENDYYF